MSVFSPAGSGAQDSAAFPPSLYPRTSELHKGGASLQVMTSLWKVAPWQRELLPRECQIPGSSFKADAE